MAVFRSSDEIIIGYMEFLPKFKKPRRHFIAVLFRGHTLFCRSLLHFLSMFIQPSKEKDLFASGTMIPGKHVGQNRSIRMTDMGLIIHIVYRRRNVEFAHWVAPFNPSRTSISRSISTKFS